MRDKIIAGNWKMNTTVDEAKTLAETMKPGLEAITSVTKIVFPPFVSLYTVKNVLVNSGIELGAQNIYPEKNGPYTGEISPSMLTDLCKYVIIGHSERRQIMGETDELINRKVRAFVDAGLKPILCIGEQLNDREKGFAEMVVKKQLKTGLEKVGSMENVIIAYEPIWAIGTNRPATEENAQAMATFIRTTLAENFNDFIAANTSILYGGSVKANNVSSFIQKTDVDGALVGGESLVPYSFVKLTQNAAATIT